MLDSLQGYERLLFSSALIIYLFGWQNKPTKVIFFFVVEVLFG